METINRCCQCQKFIDLDDCGWSDTREDHICLECKDADGHSLSILTVITDGKITKYYIGAHTRMADTGDDMYSSGIDVERKWVSSSPLRGHFETTINGWSEVLVGWTTGSWDDEISNRKQTFNEWANGVCKGEILPPMPLAIVVDQTSNVFSAGVSVQTPEPDKFKQWANLNFQDLLDSLS